MLARPEKFNCIECGLSLGQDGFCHYRGKVENGPAYWSDRGLLCSPRCSLAHSCRRAADGSLPQRPADNPLEK